MPIYEYRCQACGHELEQLQRLSDPVLKDCPACAKPKLQRLISAAGFRLKGAGWYETDFKQGNKRNLVEGSGSSSETTSGSESKSAGADTASKSETTASPKKEGGKESGKETGKQAGKDKGSTSPGKASGSSAAGSV